MGCNHFSAVQGRGGGGVLYFSQLHSPRVYNVHEVNTFRSSAGEEGGCIFYNVDLWKVLKFHTV